ncbi:MAG: mechanosensitive ion channel [Desulfuromonadaceae bacterium]|nr:mechanosensitive ion channel [Desulfuromonas sp.]MDY0185937.1 mechanosensitive ion channel [Desulfuromonadaceae bacterium]
MVISIRSGLIQCFVLLWCAVFLLNPAEGWAEKGVIEQPAVVVAPVFAGIAEVVPQAGEARRNMSADLERLKGLTDRTAWETILETRKKKQQELNGVMQEAGDLQDQSFERLIRIMTLLETQNKSLQGDMERISNQTSELESMRKRWRERYDYWQNWSVELEKQDSTYSDEDIRNVLNENIRLRENIVLLNNDYIPLQKQFIDLLEANRAHIKLVESALQNLRSTTFHQTAESFFNTSFYTQFNREVFGRTASEIALIDWFIVDELIADWWVILAQILIVLVAASIIRQYAKNPLEDRQWDFLMAHPWASGVFIAVVPLGSVYTTPSLIMRFYLALLMVLSASVLVTGIIKQKHLRNMVWLLGGTYLLTLFMQIINLPMPLMRVFIASLSLVLFLLLVRHCALSRKQQDHWGIVAAERIGVGISLVSLLAQIGGYSNLSSRLVDASFKTVFMALVVTMVIKLAQGGVNFAVNHHKTRRIHFFRHFGKVFKAQVNAIITLVVIGNALLALIQIWTGSSSIASVWEKVGYTGIEISGLHLNLVTLIEIAAILYGGLVLSWFVRSMFNTGKIGPRFIDSGARDSINTLMHYFIVFCGVMFSFSAAGIGLKNVAVIAGALSIGIGFGLQDIVNNFISGIILLFERPIRKGDTIVLDGEWAVVRHIGLRSTIVENFDKAELIVPNRELISQKVINLTHSNSQLRVVMDVRTAYGSDMEKVLVILEDEARKHPNTANSPSPSAVFVGFGESALNFKLRIWLNNLDYRLPVFSEVGIALYKRFAAEGIEIPFPQQSLHVRSMDEKVVEAWRNRAEAHAKDDEQE